MSEKVHATLWLDDCFTFILLYTRRYDMKESILNEMMRFGLRYLSKKPTVIHISTYFTDKLDKCFSVWCLIGFAPVYLSVSYVALSCLPHLNSSSTISSRRTIRSRVSLVDNNTILDLNNLPPSQMSC